MSDTTKPKPSYGQVEDTFNLSAPMLTPTLQQGAKMDSTVGIVRAKNFSEDVTLNFADVPKGIIIEPASPIIKHGSSDAKVTFKAGDDTVVGDYSMKVIGKPAKGTDAQIIFKLSVAAKDTFKLSAPRTSSIKQGAQQSVAIGIKRDKTFDQEIAVTFVDLPTGVTIEPSAPVIKVGEAETNVTMSAANDAALGDFAIKVTGHPAKGADASKEFTLTVAGK
ncbi:hypothetical protein K2X85_20860 [bacterium]|nr:hypothetical protein [bacterium]